MPLLSQQLTKGEAKLGTEIRKAQCPVKLKNSYDTANLNKTKSTNKFLHRL